MSADKGDSPPHVQLQNIGVIMRILNFKMVFFYAFSKRRLYKPTGCDNAMSNEGTEPGRTDKGEQSTMAGKTHNVVQKHRWQKIRVKGNQEKLACMKDLGDKERDGVFHERKSRSSVY